MTLPLIFDKLRFIVCAPAGAGGRFLKKAPQKLLQRGTAVPAKTLPRPSIAFPHALCRELSKSFSGVFFSLAKRIPWSERNTGKRKLAFFCPYFSRTGGEAKASPPKMTQSSAVPGGKVFAELFSKSDPPRRSAPCARRRIFRHLPSSIFSILSLFLHTHIDI